MRFLPSGPTTEEEKHSSVQLCLPLLTPLAGVLWHFPLLSLPPLFFPVNRWCEGRGLGCSSDTSAACCLMQMDPWRKSIRVLS